jgi:hypothetical protein
MLDQYIIDLVAVVHVPLLPKACGRGWRKLRPSVALSVGLAWRFASASGGENVGPRTIYSRRAKKTEAFKSFARRLT